MKIKKYFLLILSLIFINFLNLNAVTSKGNIKKLSSQKAIAEMNLTYKRILNENSTEIYDENGKLINKVKSNYPNSDPTISTMKAKIVQKNGKKIPVVESYYPNGKLHSITEYDLKVKDEDIEKNDIRKFYTSGKTNENIYNSITNETYYENGNLQTRLVDTGNKAKLEGYYKNGNLFTMLNLVVDKKTGEYYVEGTAKTYYSNGVLKSKTEFKDGELNGIYEIYHKNGKISEKATMKNGQPDGKYEIYNENGQIESSHIFKDGKLVE